tara:strand:+ start:108 stop:416 length:309 start_codon:yes stop_codon:yes gene_type:complete
VKIVTGKNLSLLKGESKKSTRAPSETNLEPASSSKAQASSSIVRQSGIDRIVRLVRDSAEGATDPRVEEIKRAIAEGTYEVSSDDIADAMIRETLKFSGIEK